MNRHIAFLALLIGSSLYAAIRGGAPERIAAGSLLAAALLSLDVASPIHRFHHIERGVLVVDTLLLGLFLWLSHRSTRYWPIWIAGFLGAEIFVHLARAAVPAAFTLEYMDAIALWSWLAQIILMVATGRHRWRLRTQGADASWKSF